MYTLPPALGVPNCLTFIAPSNTIKQWKGILLWWWIVALHCTLCIILAPAGRGCTGHYTIIKGTEDDSAIRLHWVCQRQLNWTKENIYVYIPYMGGTSQEGKRSKNWEFYPLRIGFSWPLIYFCFAGNCHVFEAYRGESYYGIY